MAKDQPAGFGDFVRSLLPLAGLVALGLGSLHATNRDMPLVGAVLLTFLSLIPLSIGPLFLMLVAYGKAKSEQMFPIAIAFNHLRLKLVFPVFLLVIAWIFAWLPTLPLILWAALGAAYFVLCLWFTTRLVQPFLGLSTGLSALVALGALCLAVL